MNDSFKKFNEFVKEVKNTLYGNNLGIDNQEYIDSFQNFIFRYNSKESIEKTIDFLPELSSCFYQFNSESNIRNIELSNDTLIISSDSIITREDIFKKIDIKKINDIKKIIVKGNIEIISDETFSNLTNLSAVYLPNSLKIISKKMFINCFNLKIVNIPFNTEIISREAFKNCYSLENINLPTNCKLKIILHGAFDYCKSIKKIEFNDQIKVLLDSFKHCENISRIIFQKNIDNILFIHQYSFCGSNLIDIKPLDIINKNKKAFFSYFLE